MWGSEVRLHASVTSAPGGGQLLVPRPGPPHSLGETGLIFRKEDLEPLELQTPCLVPSPGPLSYKAIVSQGDPSG